MSGKPKYKISIERSGEDADGSDVSQEQALRELNRLKGEDDPVAFNSRAEQMFCKLLYQLIDEFKGRLHKKQAIDESAYRLNVSPVTAKRYLDKHTTRRAQFGISGDLVIFKRCKGSSRGLSE